MMRWFLLLLPLLTDLSLRCLASSPPDSQTVPETRALQTSESPEQRDTAATSKGKDSPKVEDPTSLRDPFLKPEKEIFAERAVSDLERYPLDAFTLTGIITGPDEFLAMVLSPDGNTYYIKKGIRIGLAEGVVEEITRGTVYVREKTTDMEGHLITVRSQIRMDKSLRLPHTKKGASGGDRARSNDGNDESQMESRSDVTPAVVLRGPGSKAISSDGVEVESGSLNPAQTSGPSREKSITPHEVLRSVNEPVGDAAAP